MDQYLYIPFLVGWTSIYQLFWGSLGTRVLTHPQILLLVSPNRRKNSQHFRGVGGLQTELSSSQWGLGLKCWAYPVHSSDSFYQTHMITSNQKKKTWHVDFPRISPRSVDQTLDLQTARPLKIKQKMNNAQNCHIKSPINIPWMSLLIVPCISHENPIHVQYISHKCSIHFL